MHVQGRRAPGSHSHTDCTAPGDEAMLSPMLVLLGSAVMREHPQLQSCAMAWMLGDTEIPVLSVVWGCPRSHVVQC